MNLKQSFRFPWLRPGALAAAAAVVALGSVTFPASAQPAPPGGPGGPGMHGGMHGGMPGGMPGGMRGGRGDHEGMGMGMMMSGRMLDLVKATPEQRAKLRQIMDDARKDLRAQRESGKGLRQEAHKLFTAPTVDAAAAESLRQKMLAQHDQVSKRRMKAMVDAANVLTPEQRKTLGENMAKRRDMMERHRKEREALAPRP